MKFKIPKPTAAKRPKPNMKSKIKSQKPYNKILGK